MRLESGIEASSNFAAPKVQHSEEKASSRVMRKLDLCVRWLSCDHHHESKSPNEASFRVKY